MTSTISAQSRRELIKAIRDRYLAGSVSEKRRILDGFVALTGYHRKHAIRVLRAPLPPAASSPPRPRIYDEAVRAALVVVWESSGRSCGKRLKFLLPTLISTLESDGRLSITASVRSRLLAVSAATIDRLLANTRAAAGPHRRKRRAQPQAAELASPAIDEAVLDEPRTLTGDAGTTSSAPQPRPPNPPRPWRTRVDPFDKVWPRVVTWLEAERGQTAKLLLQRLQNEGLGEFPPRQLRTLQRRIKAWRSARHPAHRHDDPGNTPE